MLHLNFDKVTSSASPAPANDAAEVAPQELIEQHMLQLIRLGHYEAAYLFTVDGLPLAGVGSDTALHQDFLAETAIVLEQVQRAAQHSGEMTNLAEVMLEDRTGRKIVFRFIEAFGQPAVLAVMVAPHKSFRGLTNRLVRLIAKATSD
ncbi:MAG: hypothetical protein ACUVWA_13035 [Candidatus Oleimicrobiaceae bacterium]